MNARQFIKDTLNFFQYIYRNKYLLWELSKRDFQQKYAANLMGLAWAVLDPLAMMLIFWLIFGVGLRGGKDMEVPFLTYLITGLAAYLFFQQTLMQATGSIKTYSFLVKKLDFTISILPLVKIFSELALHIIVVVLALLILLGNGIRPSIYWIQLAYFIFAASMLLLGLSWFSCSVNLFFPDISNIIQIITRFFFYLTPIFWTPDIFPARVVFILKFNPMYYIVQGYRDSLLFGRPFWHNWQHGLYFWVFTLISLIIGLTVFRKLRPHFADVV
ncbi:MAG: ABC transporter permease [Desulfobacteraceae bacterium]|nr:MAG: ABC transporter permease [Desulfobacteraceae bacterium]